jgi:hypothetical protein
MLVADWTKEKDMRDEKLYTIRWTQPYRGWVPMELPITDFAEARAVIARIMAK